MDFLIKKNIIKKSKVIVDIGSKYIKMLEVHYAGKNNNYQCTKTDSTTMFQDDINYTDIAKAVSSTIGINKKLEVSVSCLPIWLNQKLLPLKQKASLTFQS